MPFYSQFETGEPLPIPIKTSERRQLAWKLLAKTNFGFRDLSAVQKLGKDALPAVLFVTQSNYKNNVKKGAKCLCLILDRDSTSLMCDLYEGYQTKFSETLIEVRNWLESKSDGQLVARRLFPTYLRVSQLQKLTYATLVARSNDSKVVKHLLSELKSPSTLPELRESLSETIPLSGNTDALQWILSQRKTSRIQTVPSEQFSSDVDSDGDGLVDVRDRNPYTPPRILGDREKLILAALQSTFSSEKDVRKVCTVYFPFEVKPFELPLTGPYFCASTRPFKWPSSDDPQALPAPSLFIQFQLPYKSGDQEAFLNISSLNVYPSKEHRYG